jgi:hypothetical protein
MYVATLAGKEADCQNSLYRKVEGTYDPEVSGRTVKKNQRNTNRVPVLKPTQVGTMKILRRSRERSRRNSAN